MTVRNLTAKYLDKDAARLGGIEILRCIDAHKKTADLMRFQVRYLCCGELGILIGSTIRQRMLEQKQHCIFCARRARADQQRKADPQKKRRAQRAMIRDTDHVIPPTWPRPGRTA